MPMDLAPQTDEALCKLAQDGDRDAEEALVLRYARLVSRLSRPLFLLGGDNEDLIQEGMLGLINAIRDYAPERGAAFPGFAEVCVKNRLLSAIRSAAGKHHTPLNDSVPIETPLLDEQIQLSFLQVADPEDQLIRRETVEEKIALLRSKLSGFEAKVLGFYLSGLSNSEIAGQMQRSPKSIDNAIQRVRRKCSLMSFTPAFSAQADRINPVREDTNRQKREGKIMFEDKTLVCKECGNEFVFTAGEQEFYAEHGFQNEPQRCKSCRDARKNATRAPRQFFTAVCANCGGEARVPFEPKSDRPVYCSNCFAQMRGDR